MRSAIWRHFDFLLFAVVVLLSIFGIAMVRSALAGVPGWADTVQRQVIFVIIGLAVMIITAIVDYHYWASIIRPLYILTLILLLVTVVLTRARFGASRWLETGIGFLIQPSEIGKIVIILMLAEYFAKAKDEVHDLRWIIRSLLPTAGLVTLILLQPNLSTAIVVMVLWFAMLWISGLKIKYLAILAASLAIAVPLIFPFLAPYQQQRVVQFIIPDPTSQHGDRYNVDQALITIGSGGLFGMGYGHGTQAQLRFLKVRQTDFIFAVMAEEFGFVGTMVVILLIFVVVLRCLRAARLASDMYGALIAYGFGVLIFFQTSVNIGVNLRVIPVTGLTLPFISYGGSSLLSLVLGIGLVESIVLRHKPLDF
jgi:rod shape determining protein RodA